MISALCSLAVLASTIICDPAQIEAVEVYQAVQIALPLIKKYEGLRLCAYGDPRPGDPLLTIGYGHTGRDVKPGMCITREQADDLVERDAIYHVRGARKAIKANLALHRWGAICSLYFNLGIDRATKSGIVAAINRGNFALATRRWMLYCYAGRPPIILRGLQARRKSEVRLFNGGR